jgi:ABC-2 type transport system ATP-binding protein
MGMQKLFLIAFALSTRCKVLLLDEPSNGLDIPNKQLFRKLLLRHSNPEQTILIATHQVRDIEDVVERLLILHDGHFIVDMDLLELSNAYTFGFSTTKPEEAFYYERFGGGYHFIAASTEATAVQTAVNIELLFNASIHYQLPFLTQKIENHG